MKDFIIFIIFLIYAFFIFAINNFLVLLIFLAANIILILCFKINFKSIIKNILFLLPFIAITSIINLFFENSISALLIAFKLIIVCNITFIFKTIFGNTKILKSIEMLFAPFRIFGINPAEISLIINIAIVFIPNFIQNLREIKYALYSKACKPYSISGIKYTLKILLISIFKKTSEMELSLKSKGFSEN